MFCMPATAPPLTLLLVEDDLDVAAGIGDYLSVHGVQVDYAGGVGEARARVLEGHFDLLLLDVNLPDGDGYALCRELKTEWGLEQPILFLTASGELDARLQGFAAGAVDYISKPFAPAELLARVRAIATHMPAGAGARLQVGGYSLDLRRRLLSRGDGHLRLHASAFVLLRALMQAWPGSVGREALCAALWPEQPPDSDPLRSHVYQLRRTLQGRFGQPLVATVRGIGYRFSLEDSDDAD